MWLPAMHSRQTATDICTVCNIAVVCSYVQVTQQQTAHIKVAQYPGFLRLTNLEIHAGRLFAFLIC